MKESKSADYKKISSFFTLVLVLGLFVVFIVWGFFEFFQKSKPSKCGDKYQIFKQCVPINVINKLQENNPLERALGTDQAEFFVNFFQEKGLLFDITQQGVFTEKGISDDTLIELADRIITSDAFPAAAKDNIALTLSKPIDGFQGVVYLENSRFQLGPETGTLALDEQNVQAFLVPIDLAPCLKKCDNQPPEAEVNDPNISTPEPGTSAPA